MKDYKLTKYLKLVKASFMYIKQAEGIHTNVIESIFESLSIICGKRGRGIF